MGELFERGETECPRVIRLSTDARRLLLSARAGVLAAQIALLFYHCVSGTRPELDVEFIAAALPIARELRSRSAEVSRMVRHRRDEALVERTKTEMLRRLKRVKTVRRREFGRSFHNYRPWPHGVALAAVLASGRACQHREKEWHLYREQSW